METFTLELDSSASSKLWPQNTIAPFMSFLPDQIDLKGQWEVALIKYCFPSKFRNVLEGNFGISVSKGRKGLDSEKYKFSPCNQR